MGFFLGEGGEEWEGRSGRGRGEGGEEREGGEGGGGRGGRGGGRKRLSRGKLKRKISLEMNLGNVVVN